MARKPKVQSGLNPEQQAVVDHDTGPLRVVATAGSGKTTALVERAARLVESGVPTDKILLISFSVIAKSEMEKRMNARLPGRGADKMCRTFHSIGLDIFRNEVDTDRSWAVDSTGAMTSNAIRTSCVVHGVKGGFGFADVMREALSRAKNAMLLEPPSLRKLGSIDDDLIKMARSYAGVLEALHVTGRGGSDIEAHDILDVLHTAEDIRRGIRVPGVAPQKKFVNYDDMLLHAVESLSNREVHQRWANRWQYVMQDEAQDENIVQAALAEAICRVHRNYMIVGDPAQSVFGFRGSEPKKMLAFEDEWPGAVTIEMTRNYRSGVEIVEASNLLVGEMPADTVIGYEASSMRATRAYVASGKFDSDELEAEAIASNIVQHHLDGIAWKDQAVLVRSNFQACAIETALSKAGVPYSAMSSDSFFKMPETGFLFGAMKLLGGRGTGEDLRMALTPLRAGKEFVDRVVARFEEDPNKSWLNSIDIEAASPMFEAASPYAKRRIFDWIGVTMSYAVIAKIDPSAVVPRPREIADQLVAIVKDDFKADANGERGMRSRSVESAKSFCYGYDTVEELCSMLTKIEAQSSSRSHDKVRVSTVHKAKGAEWPVVYVAGCSTDMFPAKDADLTEERRLFYVAITRAMDELWISYVSRTFNGSTESRFVKEAGIGGGWEKPGRKIFPQPKMGDQLSLI